MMNKYSILIVEDEALIAASLVHALSSLGYTVPEPVATGEDAIRSVKTRKPDLVLMDIKLAGAMDGIETAEKIRAFVDIPIVYLTAFTDDTRLTKARLTEPYGFIVKPAHSRELHATIEMALYKHALDRKLKESEDKYRTLIETTDTGFVFIDPDGLVLDANPEYVRLTGHHDLREIVGRSVIEWTADYEKEKNAAAIKTCFAKGSIRNLEIDYVDSKGNVTPIEINATCIEIGGKTQTITICRDITERELVEEALQASEQRYRDIVEDQTEFICRFLPDGWLTFINDAYCTYFRLNREECIGKRHSVVLPPEDAQQMKDHLAALTPENPVATISHRTVMPSGEVRWQRWSDRAIFNNEGAVIEYQSVGRDITRQKETEIQLENYKESLEQRVHDRTIELSATNLKLKKEIEDRKKIQKKLTISSNEKDLLLREVHHRVKNNLQLIIGLVDMTKTRAQEPAVRSTLTDIMIKVQTMGSIHSRLYESKRFDKINMKQQVHDLVDMISGFCDHDHLDITTNIKCAEIYLPVDQAIPSALALNEIITNIYKHAFSGRRSGLVEISSSVKGDQIRFVVRDNGVGLPTGFDIEKSNRLGLKLMRTLVEQQLHGSVTITSIAGTEVVIEFPINWGE